MNSASNESIDNTTNATIALVVVILLVVYRSPLLALIPLLTIALSVQASLWAIALLTKVPGPELPGDQHHEHLRDRRPLRGGDGLLPVPDRPVPRGADPRPVARRRPARGDHAGRRGPGRQRGDGDRRPGDALVLDVRQDPVHRPGDRPEPGDRPGGVADAGPGAAALAPRGDLLAVPPAAPREGGRPRAGEPGADAAVGLLARRWPTWSSAARARSWPLCVLGADARWPSSAPGPGRTTASSPTSNADQPSVIGAQDHPEVFRRGRARARPAS